MKKPLVNQLAPNVLGRSQKCSVKRVNRRTLGNRATKEVESEHHPLWHRRPEAIVRLRRCVFPISSYKLLFLDASSPNRSLRGAKGSSFQRSPLQWRRDSSMKTLFTCFSTGKPESAEFFAKNRSMCAVQDDRVWVTGDD